MNKINMTKYGFVYCPEENFSDDGSYFHMYKVGRVRVSKLCSAGYAFIAGRIDGNILEYEEYSSLPHFKMLGKYNYVPRDSITDQDLTDLYNACVAYDQEYTELENKVKAQFPSEQDVREWVKIKSTCSKIKFELLEKYISTHLNNLFALSEYDLKSIKRYYNDVKNDMTSMQDIDERVQFCIDYSRQRAWLKADPKALTNYSVKYCLEYLNIDENKFKSEYDALVQKALGA